MQKTWFITGATAGIGQALTEQVLARGDRVIAAVRRPEALSDLARRYDGALMSLPLDLADPVSIRKAIAMAFEETGRIDAIVAAAGYGLFGAAEELTDAQIERQVKVNLLGSMQLIRAALPYLRRQGGGQFLHLSSEGGQIAYPCFSAYHAVKWGIEGFIESTALEVAPLGITFMIAEPGPTDTSFAGSIDIAEAMAAYRDTPAGQLREMIASGGFQLTGDPGRTAAALIRASEAGTPPLRLVLGSIAYDNVVATLRARLDEIEPQREVAYSADKT